MSKQWLILKANEQCGPYSQEQVIELLQNGTVYGFDYAWTESLDSWTHLADIEEFSSDRIHRLVTEKQQDSFKERKNKRIECNLESYCHNNELLWDGKVESLSSEGALICMNNPLLLPKTNITIHILALGETLEAEIINKKLIKNKIKHNSKIHYAVRFLSLQNDQKKLLSKFVESFKKGESA